MLKVSRVVVILVGYPRLLWVSEDFSWGSITGEDEPSSFGDEFSVDCCALKLRSYFLQDLLQVRGACSVFLRFVNVVVVCDIVVGVRLSLLEGNR